MSRDPKQMHNSTCGLHFFKGKKNLTKVVPVKKGEILHSTKKFSNNLTNGVNHKVITSSYLKQLLIWLFLYGLKILN